MNVDSLILFIYLFIFSSSYSADDEQDTDPRSAIKSESCSAGRSLPGAPSVRLHSAAMLPAPPGWPGVLHETHPGGQERPLQTVQLCLCQKWQTLSQRVSKTREERRVGGGTSALSAVSLSVEVQTDQ